MAVKFNPFTSSFDIVLDKAEEIQNTPSGGISATNVQDAIDELDSEKVSGPASATDNTVPRFDSTTGKLIQTSGVSIDDSNNMLGVTQITVAGDAVSSLQVVTLQQLQAAVEGVNVKAGVVVATTANITLSGEQTIDGVLTSTSRVLVKAQTTQTENGIYVSAAGAWSRASDANTSAELNHALVTVGQGSTFANTGWYQITDNPVIGSDNIVWNQWFGAGTYTADGQGIELSGSTFSLELDGSTLSKSSSGLRVASGGITNTEVNASAAIAYSKLNLSNSIVNADVNTSAAIAYSKLNLSNSIVNADISTSAAIDATKLGGGTVDNTEFGYLNGVTDFIQTQLNDKQNTVTGAATTIVTSNLTADRAVISNVSGKIAVAATTSTEIGHLVGVTSAVQTQLDARVVGPASATDNAITRYDGTTGKLVQNSTVTISDLGAIEGVASVQILDQGSLILREGSGGGTDSVSIRAPATLAASYTLTLPADDGAPSQFLQTDGSGALSWAAPSQVATIVSVSSNVTLTTFAIHLVDTSAARSVTLPSAPATGTRLTVKDVSGTANVNNITIVRAASETIEGASASYVMDMTYQSIDLVSDASGNWWII